MAFHGAGGSTEAVGAVCDMVETRRVSRRDTVDEAMVADASVPLSVCNCAGRDGVGYCEAVC
jgi:hypothetical protein